MSNGAVPQLSSEKLSICYASFSAMFNPLHNNTNWQLFEKLLNFYKL